MIHKPTSGVVRTSSIKRAARALAATAVAVLFFGVARPTAGSAQAVLRGFVTEADTGQPLAGATVSVQASGGGDRVGTVADGDGFYRLPRLDRGPVTIRFSFLGFETAERALTLVEGVNREDAALTQAALQVDEIIVEATAEAGIAAVAAGLQRVVAREVARVPMPGATGDLVSYLQTVPGYLSQGDRGGQFFVRGGAADQNLTLLDGIPLYRPVHILSFYSAFSDEIIDRADIYTGGFGARYGGRISSVIDVDARNGSKRGLRGSVALAPFLSSLRVEGPLIAPDRASVLVSVRRSMVEELVPALFEQRLDYMLGDAFAKVHAFLSDAHSLSVTGFTTRDRGDLAGTRKTFEGDVISEAQTDSTRIFWRNDGLGVRYDIAPGRARWRTHLAAAYARMDSEFGPSAAPDRSAVVESIDLSAGANIATGWGTIASGGSWRRGIYRFELSDQFSDFQSGKEEMDEIQGFVELQSEGRRVRITPGLHLYHAGLIDATYLEPRLRVGVSVGNMGLLHAAAGRYHQGVVGLNDERDIGNVFTVWRPADKAVGAQGATHVIVGWSAPTIRATRPAMPDQAGEAPRSVGVFNFAVEGFWKSLDQLNVPVFSAFPRFTTALQQASGTAVGADVRLDFSGIPFELESTLDGSLSYQLSRVEYQTATADYTPAHDRRHQVVGLISARKGELSLTAQFQFGSGLPYNQSAGFDRFILLTPDVDVSADPGLARVLYGPPFAGRQPAYRRVDLWFERTIEGRRSITTLRAGVVNLFNRANLFYYDLFDFSRVDQLPFIPSVGLKIELR